MPKVIIVDGEEIGKEYTWSADMIRIGRNHANDFVISNASVSGEHCVIEKFEGGWRIRDLDSTNGTKQNNQPIQMAVLYRGDVISLGDISLSLSGDDVPLGDPNQVEAADSIPRTTIIMRPTKVSGPTEGFTKRSEPKKALNIILIIVIAAILAVALILILMLLGIL